MAKWILDNHGTPHCDKCGTVSEKETNFCSYCGDKMDEEDVNKRCEFCEYMHEVVLRYDDEKILRPECWGQKNPIRVKYTDGCKDFKQRGLI